PPPARAGSRRARAPATRLGPAPRGCWGGVREAARRRSTTRQVEAWVERRPARRAWQPQVGEDRSTVSQPVAIELRWQPGDARSTFPRLEHHTSSRAGSSLEELHYA